MGVIAPAKPTGRTSPPPPLVTKGFLRGFGILVGIGIAAAGLLVPWTTGVLFIGLGVVVVAVVAIAAK